MNTRTYVIPIRFLNLAINDEVMGLEESDFELWDNFFFLNKIDLNAGHWSYEEQEPYFSWNNDLNKVGGSVVEIQWVKMPSRTPGLLKGQLGDAFFEPLSEEELQQFN